MKLWDLFISIGQSISGYATLFLVVLTFLYLRATIKIAKATEAQIRESKKPLLCIEKISRVIPGVIEPYPATLTLSNYGSGPAVNIKITYSSNFLWGTDNINEFHTAHLEYPIAQNTIKEINFGNSVSVYEKRDNDVFYALNVIPNKPPVNGNDIVMQVIYNSLNGETYSLNYLLASGRHVQVLEEI